MWFIVRLTKTPIFYEGGEPITYLYLYVHDSPEKPTASRMWRGEFIYNGKGKQSSYVLNNPRLSFTLGIFDHIQSFSD